MDLSEGEGIRDERPSLADPAVVQVLVRQYAARVFEARASWRLGLPGAHEPLKSIEADARAMGEIFIGHGAHFDAPPWNSDDKLGMYFKVLLPEETAHLQSPGAALFYWLAYQLCEGAAALERDASAEADVQRRIECIIQDVLDRLLQRKW